MENLLSIINSQEKIQSESYYAKIHWISYIIPIAFILVGSLGILPFITIKGFGLLKIISFLFIYFFIKGIILLLLKKSSLVIVSNGKLTLTSGIFTKKITDLSLSRLEEIQVSQNILGRLMSYGRLTISTGKITQSYSIKNPMKLREIILKSSNNNK